MSNPATQQAPATSLLEFLESWPWYRALPTKLQRLILDTTVERTASPGEYIARAGEPCMHWYGLLHGFLQMYVLGADGGETTLYCLREGQWGGEGSLLNKELRRYDLRSLTQSHIFMVPVETFETLRGASIGFNHFLCDIMNERMGVFVGMLEASRLLGPDMRVARGLLMLAGNHTGNAQDLLIPQHELGLICGLSRQRVNMAISELKRIGLVRSEVHKGIVLVNVARLRAHVLEASALDPDQM